LGAQTNSLTDGGFLEDGSVIFSDYDSWHYQKAKPFSVELSGHQFSGSFLGVCALKVDADGNIEKFACGGFTELKRDGQTVFSLDHSADIVLRRSGQGGYEAIIVDSQSNHFTSF
jgi:hypothetical protein